MVYSILEILLPIVVALVTGVFLREKRLMSNEGCSCVKTILIDILLPVTLFNSMLLSDFSSDTFVQIITCTISMYLIYGIGCLTRRFVPGREKYYPFAVSTWEGGSMGAPLAALAFGTAGLSKMVVLDFGHAFFLFVFAIPYLQILDGKKPTAGGIVKAVFTSPVFDAIILGTVLSLLGVNDWLRSSKVWSIYNSLVSNMTGSVSFLVLVTVGFSFRINRENLKDIVLTTVLRFVIFLSIGLLTAFIVSLFVDFNRNLLKVYILAYTLPPSFGLPIFSKMEGNLDYMTGVISLSSIVSLVVFSILVICG